LDKVYFAYSGLFPPSPTAGEREIEREIERERERERDRERDDGVS
jgi:hypothetical protein